MAEIEALDWVFHQQGRGEERAPIYSIDMHPDGTRFATGSNEVKIWSTASLKGFGEPFSDASSESGDSSSGGGSEDDGKTSKDGRRPHSSASSSSGLSSDSEDEDDEEEEEDEEEDGDDDGEVDLGDEDSRARRRREKKAAKKRAKQAAQQQQNGNGSAAAAEASKASSSTAPAAAACGGGGGGGGVGSSSPQIPEAMRARMMMGGGLGGGTSTLGFGNANGGGGGSDKENKGGEKRRNGGTGARYLLATLGSHTAPVNCVRWSHKGRFLASASDDTSILLWEMSAQPATAAFGEAPGTENAENWSKVLTCMGHRFDVVHVDWAADDSLLASASLDNKVMIWAIADGMAQGKRLINPTHQLDGHEGPVKGVAWDPVGKYLASAGDDRALLVWRTADWGLEARITRPFSEAATKQETMFRRIAWSPGGDAIVATNASQSKKHVLQVLRRAGSGASSKGEGAWLTEITLVGHDSPVTCSRFAPVIFQPTAKDGRLKPVYNVMASGDDGSGNITVWSSKKERALLVGQGVFSSAVTDLSWSKDALTLLACSRDGTAVVVAFDRGALIKKSGGGRPMTAGDLADFFRRTYGCQMGGGLAQGGRGLVLRETVLPSQQQQGSLLANGAGTPLGSPSHSQQSQPFDSPAIGGNGGRAAPYTTGGGVTGGGGASPAGSVAQQTNWLQPRPKDGAKKRVRPALVTAGGGTTGGSLPSSRGAGASALPMGFVSKRARTTDGTAQGGGGGAGPAGAVTVVMFEKEGGATLEIPCPYAAKPGALTRIVTDFAGFCAGGGGEDDGFLMDDEDGRGGGMGMAPLAPVVLDCQVEEKGAPGLGPWPMSRLRASRAGRLLWREVVPGRAMTLCGNGTLMAVGCQDGSIHLYGATGLRLCPPLVMGGGGVALLECTHVPGRAADHYHGGIMEDSQGGDSEDEGNRGPGALTPEAMYLLAISKAGEVRVWDLYRMRAVATASLRALFSSLQHLLALPDAAADAVPKPRITRAKVLKGGVPCLEVAVPDASSTASSGSGAAAGTAGTVKLTLVYDTGMEAWMRVGDSRYALSDYAALSSYAARGGSGGGGAGPVTMSVVMRGEQERVARAEVSRAHLESRLASAILLDEAPTTVTNHLRALVLRLVRDDDPARLSALCDRLLGRRGAEAEGTAGDETAGGLSWWRRERRELVTGLRKREALAEVVLPTLTAASAGSSGAGSGGGGAVAGASASSSSRASAAVQRIAKQFHDALAAAEAR